MNVSGINSAYQHSAGLKTLHDGEIVTKPEGSLHSLDCPDGEQAGVSFKGNGSKKFWLMFRRLSNYMKDPSEMTNAIIAAVGTGGIAPIAIMMSPGKKADNVEDKKKEREKKTFQALRQPVSAALAFGFQVPTTIGIAKLFNNMAYEKQVPMFNDEILGTLIPDTKYLRKQANKTLKESANEELKSKWTEELKKVANTEEIKRELAEQIKDEYKNVGVEISEEELKKMASEPKKLRKFTAEKMAKIKHESLIDAKVDELINKGFDFNKIAKLDLVTEEFQNQAIQQNKAIFESIRKDANLSVFDKFLEAIGFSNKKLKNLESAQKKKAQELGLAILEKEEPNLINDNKAKLRKYVENMDKKSQKLYGNKIFWLTLVTNLFMVAISCIALNWLHPKFAAFVDRLRGKNDANQSDKKVEVRA